MPCGFNEQKKNYVLIIFASVIELTAILKLLKKRGAGIKSVASY